MRAAKAIIFYAVGLIVVSVLLAPWAYKLVHPLLPTVPFHRVFNRVVLIVALAGLWPMLGALGMRSWHALGLPCAGAWWRYAILGFALGIASFAIAGALLVAVGARGFDAKLGMGTLAAQVLKFAAIGVIVALIEETFFRGGLQGGLERSVGRVAALVVTSAVYSMVHFLKPKGVALPPEAVTWLSGVDYLGRVLVQMTQRPGVGIGFVTLLLAGLTLGWAFVKTRALYFSMGLHAGWVITLKTFSLLTDGTRLIENATMWPVLVAVLLFVVWLCRAKLKPLTNDDSVSMAQTSR